MDKDLKKEFEKLDKRFDGIGKRFDGIDKRFNGVATKDDLKPFATKDDLKPFATKDDLKAFATKDDLKAQTKELKAFAVEQTEELARIANGGFNDVLDRLDVRERMAKMEKKMARIEHALHMEVEV